MVKLILVEAILLGLVFIIAFVVACKGKQCGKFFESPASSSNSLLKYKIQEYLSWVAQVEEKSDNDDTYHRMISDVD